MSLPPDAQQHVPTLHDGQADQKGTSSASPTAATLFTNYQQALDRAGFRVLFSCGGTTACGRGAPLARTLYPVDQVLHHSGRNSEYAFNMPRDERYVSAQGNAKGKDVYVSIYIAREGNSALERIRERAVILLDVIETTTMETGRVTVDAAAMAKGLAAEGRVALYEIYFDTGSATVKPERKSLNASSSTERGSGGYRFLVHSGF